jgi:superkiller protein 3
LPDSELYPALSKLPSADATNPTLTTFSEVQSAIHNSLPVLQNIVSIIERSDEEAIRREFDRRRTRLGAPPAIILKKEVTAELLGASEVGDSLFESYTY